MIYTQHLARRLGGQVIGKRSIYPFQIRADRAPSRPPAFADTARCRRCKYRKRAGRGDRRTDFNTLGEVMGRSTALVLDAEKDRYP